ncbi:RNA polymerase subunit sigma-70 [Acetobacterium sp. KB-1]|nr:RNA polymerase subunit sigma-70 [Acetobacterium sp. KB-1]
MTNEQKDQIHELRILGISYSKIADDLNLSENTVKSYCRRHNLGKDMIKKSTAVLDEKDTCKQCGKPFKQESKGRHKKFCSENCRRLWWKTNESQIKRKSYYSQVCLECGKTFKSYGNTKRKFCSHDCYIKHRFGERPGNQ